MNVNKVKFSAADTYPSECGDGLVMDLPSFIELVRVHFKTFLYTNSHLSFVA